MKKKPSVSIVMGSDSDMPVMSEVASTLDKFGISYDIMVCSAHRSPEKAATLAKTAKKRGVKVIIAGAGGAAHLAGVLASHTILPVIGVPMASKLDGLDSLLSTVQMPSGVPVATVAIGKAGATNAAILAAQILGVGSAAVSKKLQAYKRELVRKIDAKNRKLKKK
ncbi:MAG: 5-(carboxyamino)imidazole ribonucleotide mutase [Candidatus Tantalella remota]|nr:5-(carboxyamino)imidazole ribonucleotide mutase [Candidatus Tantalella remota]